MKTKFGSIVVGGSGKLGGTSLQRNTGGYSMRSNSFKPRHPSSASFKQRSNIAVISSFWRSLSSAQRSLWSYRASLYSRFDSLGNRIVLSGFNFFVAFQNYILLVGLPLYTGSGYNLVIARLSSYSLSCSVSLSQLFFTFSPSPPSESYILLYVTRSKKSSVKPLKSDFVYFDRLSISYFSPHNLYSLYQSKFGSVPVVGEVIYLKLVYWRYSNPINPPSDIISCVVSA